MDGRFTVFFVVRSSKGFTINSDGFATERHGHIVYPPDEELIEAVWIDSGKEASEGVVRRNSVGQLQKWFEPLDFGSAIFSDLSPRVRPADDAAKSDQEHIVKTVADVVMSRVRDTVEMF